MAQVNELLQKRSEGWSSDEEEAGEGLYYTDKQIRALTEIVRNPDGSLSEIAEKAGVHPSYVRYIINRLPKDRASDMDWLKQKVEFNANGNGPPSLSKEEDEAPEQDEEEEPQGAFAEQIASKGDEVALEQYRDESEGEFVSIPIQVEVKVPKALFHKQ